MFGKVFEELLWKFVGAESGAKKMLSLSDDMLPLSGSPKIVVNTTWGEFVERSSGKIPLLLLPPDCLRHLSNAELSWTTSFKGYSNGSGMSVNDFSLKSKNDDVWRSVMKLSKIGFDPRLKSETLREMFAYLKVSHSLFSKRLTLPTDFESWIFDMRGWFASKSVSHVEGCRGEPDFAWTASVTLGDIVMSSYPENVAREACRKGLCWSKR